LDESLSASLPGLNHRNISLPDVAVPRESPDILESRNSTPVNETSSDTSENSNIDLPTKIMGRPLGVKNKPDSWFRT
jgi:hypothetical protein